ncbi:hypothetical protein [Cylindrospermum stagnale]|uniref:hypothetical protein n=1 Tax=Cylindrospermum stagnale TaxID=142864 RepID=UPI0002DD9BFE|nr:hypothetical protein [Cylindrospermum stagnale]
MTHIATQEVLDGKPVDWMSKVSDEQYQQDLRFHHEETNRKERKGHEGIRV